MWMSAAFEALVRATSAGELTCEEAIAVGGLLELQRKALETVELAERFAALERKMETMRK
jgi:hypothetical protein